MPNKSLRKRLKPLIRKTQPYTKRIAHKGIWVEPELLVEIEYRAKSAEGKVRHPLFKSEKTCELGTHRPKLCHRDWHHIHHGGWRLPCDTISSVGAIGASADLRGCLAFIIVFRWERPRAAVRVLQWAYHP